MRRACLAALAALVVLICSAPPLRAAEPVQGTVGGGGAGGTGSVIGETVVQIVRAAYPGSGLTYAPSSIAASLIAMLTGKIEYAIAASGEMHGALDGEAPFRRSYPAQNLHIVANLLDPRAMVAAVYARREFVEAHGIESLAQLAERDIPVRLSTNALGNVPTIRHNRTVFDVIGLSEALLEQRGGKDYHLPDTAGLGLMQDNKLDVIVTLGFHPDHRVVQTGRAVPLMLLPFGDGVPQQVAERLGTQVATIPAGTYEFLDSDYLGSTMGGLYLAAGPAADDDATYRIARALFEGMDRLRQAHRSFATMERALLVAVGDFPLHPAAARFYREVGLLPERTAQSGQ